MKESYRKGLANRLDPESCTGSREAVGEALTAAASAAPYRCGCVAFLPIERGTLIAARKQNTLVIFTLTPGFFWTMLVLTYLSRALQADT